MSAPANILLIGPRGCGKTTVGAELAARCDADFVDLDTRVMATFPERTVTAIWQTHGEQAWRDAEVRVLSETLESAGRVVALGGGVPTLEAARRRIDDERRAGRCVVVYLACTPSTLAERLRTTPGDRPSLTGADVSVEAKAVLEQREPLYRSLADLVIDADTGEPAAIAARIDRAVRQRET